MRLGRSALDEATERKNPSGIRIGAAARHQRTSCLRPPLRSAWSTYSRPTRARMRCGPSAHGRDPHRRHQAAGCLVLASGEEDSAWQGHRRGRRPCSAGSAECLSGFCVRVVGLSSMISMISARPAGIGLCMSPGRMEICPSDGSGSTSFVRRGVASWPYELEIGSPPPRVVAIRTPGLEPGTSSLSGIFAGCVLAGRARDDQLMGPATLTVAVRC